MHPFIAFQDKQHTGPQEYQRKVFVAGREYLIKVENKNKSPKICAFEVKKDGKRFSFNTKVGAFHKALPEIQWQEDFHRVCESFEESNP